MSVTTPSHKLSIEYAHIYTNQKINDEHQLSVDELKHAMSQQSNGDVILTVMIDDYSFPDPTFSYDDFTTWLTEQGYKPDVVLRESQLIPVCDEVLKLIPDELPLKVQLVDYIKAKKYPCSLFIAAWYMLRLGLINHSLFDAQNTADTLLNILPASFEPFEKKGLEIIAATGHDDAVERIDYRWIEGRLIA